MKPQQRKGWLGEIAQLLSLASGTSIDCACCLSPPHWLLVFGGVFSCAVCPQQWNGGGLGGLPAAKICNGFNTFLMRRVIALKNRERLSEKLDTG